MCLKKYLVGLKQHILNNLYFQTKNESIDWSKPEQSEDLSLDWSQPEKKIDNVDDELKLEWSDDPDTEEEEAPALSRGSSQKKKSKQATIELQVRF